MIKILIIFVLLLLIMIHITCEHMTQPNDFFQNDSLQNNSFQNNSYQNNFSQNDTFQNNIFQNNFIQNYSSENDLLENNPSEDDTSQDDTSQNDPSLNKPLEDNNSQNDTSENDTSQNDTLQNDTSQNDSSQNDSSQNNSSQNYPLQNYNQQATLHHETSDTKDSYQNMLKCNDDDKVYEELIEINELPLFKDTVVANYQININTVNNNSTSIFQEITDPLSNTCDINSNNYNLINVEFRKSKFLYNNTAIGLELHLMHINYDSMPNYNIIIPLDLTNNPYASNTENFINVLYKKMDLTVKTFENEFAEITNETQLDATVLKNNNITNIIQKEKDIFNLKLNYKRPYDINSVSVNKLIDDPNLISNYECCGTVIGHVKQFNLCLLNSIINSTSNFHVIKDNNNNNYLIGEPIPFNEDTGLLMRTNLTDNQTIKYIKSN